MTSSPPSSGSPRQSRQRAPCGATGDRGFASLRDWTLRLTARADDSRAAPVPLPASTSRSPFGVLLAACQALVRFSALYRIEPRAPPLVRASPIPLDFNLAAVLTRRDTCRVSCAPGGVDPRGQVSNFYGTDYPGIQSGSLPVLSRLSVGSGPEGCLRPRCSSRTHRILLLRREFHLPLPRPSARSIDRPPRVEPGAFTADLPRRLRALYAQ